MASSEEEVREQIESEISEDMIAHLAERLGATATASAVFGAPVEQDGVKIIPVARARWGIGGGNSKNRKKDEKGSGIGGGVQTTPVGYIEFTSSGVEYRRINDPLRYLPALIVLPIAIALSAAMVMSTAAVIGTIFARRAVALTRSFRLPLPHLTFRS